MFAIVFLANLFISESAIKWSIQQQLAPSATKQQGRSLDWSTAISSVKLSPVNRAARNRQTHQKVNEPPSLLFAHSACALIIIYYGLYNGLPPRHFQFLNLSRWSALSMYFWIKSHRMAFDTVWLPIQMLFRGISFPFPMQACSPIVSTTSPIFTVLRRPDRWAQASCGYCNVHKLICEGSPIVDTKLGLRKWFAPAKSNWRKISSLLLAVRFMYRYIHW